MVRIPDDKVEQVRDASDIVDVVSSYLNLSKKGRNYFGLCPFHHEKTPSFSVNPELQIFHCFGCGAGGNVFTFVMRMEGITFPEAIKQLAQAAGIVLPEADEDLDQLKEKEALFYVHDMAQRFFSETLLESPEAEAARTYLRSRDIDTEMIKTYDIGYAPDRWNGLLQHAEHKTVNPGLLVRAGLVSESENGRQFDRFRGRITFAIRNPSGRIVAFGARRLRDDDDSPKYLNSPETEIYKKRFILYGLYWAREAIRRENRAVVVEGYTDLIRLRERGVETVVTTSGTSLTEEHARLLRRYAGQVVLLFDSDTAGSAATLRGADLLLENGLDVRIAALPEGQDPDDYARTHTAEDVAALLEGSASLLDYKVQQLDGKSPAERAEATREMVASLSRISDGIQQSFMLRELATRLGVDEGVLWSELSRHKRPAVRSTPKQTHHHESQSQTKHYFDTMRGSAELGLLQVILSEPELTPKIMSIVTHEDIRDSEIARIYRAIEADLIDSSSYHPMHYLTSIQDPYIAEKLSNELEKHKSAVEGNELPGLHKNDLEIKKRLALDCILRLFLVKTQEEIEALKSALKHRQSGGRGPTEIMQQIRELQEREKQIKSRQVIDEKHFFDD
jgi:DNA primase